MQDEGNCSKRRKICPHCSQNISYSAYLSHKARYFDSQSSQWSLASDNISSSLDAHNANDSADWNDCFISPSFTENLVSDSGSDTSSINLESDSEDQEYEALEVSC